MQERPDTGGKGQDWALKTISTEQYAEKYLDKVNESTAGIELSEAEEEDYYLPKRALISHKYSYGRAMIIGGAAGYTGAPVLAANACERSGAGLTQLAIPESIYAVAAAKCDGAVVVPVPAAPDGGFSLKAGNKLLDMLGKAKSCVVGPGLGTGQEARDLVRRIVRGASCPLVLDADALSACAGEEHLLPECSVPVIITPHEGEFRRLGGDLSEGRLKGALRFTEAHPRTILILKGYGTLVCQGRKATVNPTGGPAMAKGGSGDVLSGILGALLAQGFEPWFAARCAVWLHGFSGDLASGRLGEYSVTPSDLIRFLPDAFLHLVGKAAENEKPT